MKHKIVSFFLPATLCLLVVACGGKYQAECGISEVSQRGIDFVQPTIDAMERYKKDNGKYPADVFELTPRYIDKIPIVLHSKQGVDETKYKILVEEKLRGGVPRTVSDGSRFSVEFISNDERACLTGRNNICEYSSENPFWNCHQ